MGKLKMPSSIDLLPSLEEYLRSSYATFGLTTGSYLEMSLFKAAHFISLRNQRVDDLMSNDFLESVAIKSRYFPLENPLFVICIDGRVLTKLIACFNGVSYHVPAGDTKIDFLPIKNNPGKLMLKEGVLSRMIGRLIRENNSIQIILDSHLHCAAGGLSANDRHCCEVADAGLRDDVIRKTAMKEAILEYGKEYFPEAKIMVTQIAFNPDDGFSFFGLEKKDCLAASKEKGYTKEVIDSLLLDGKIISTKELAEKQKEDFLKAYFDCDYRLDYRQSTKKFWQNFSDFWEKISPLFFEIGKSLGINDPIENQQISALLLASAYNGFLHNNQADGSAKDYSYAVHKESVITVTVSESGPFSGAESFFVHPEAPDISAEIKLGRSLIVGNRQKHRMSPLEIEAVESLFPEYESYIKAPVLAFFFQRSSRILLLEEIKTLQSIDWSDVLSVNWFETTNQEFTDNYLEKKWPGIPAAVAYAINRLRQQAVDIYQPNQAASEDFLSGRIIPIWVLAGPNRQILSVIPFLINGYIKH